MTKQVLFIQGAGEGAHTEDAVLAESLTAELGRSCAVHYPSMPDEADPDEHAWSNRIAGELEGMGNGVILVGHSAGAVTVLSFLGDAGLNKGKVAGIFLVGAPFFGSGGWQGDGFELPKDIATTLPDVPIFFYHGGNDAVVPVAHLDLYARAVPQAVVHRLAGRDHQLDGDMSEVAADIRSLS